MTRGRMLVLVFLVAGAALTLRWPALDLRPMHNDEGVNAFKFATFWDGAEYRYDPHEYHGPTLAYSTWLVQVLTRAPTPGAAISDARFRFVAVLFGIFVILLLLGLQDGLGRGATLLSATLLAFSPAFAFYSRYYIHEILLVCFSLAALVGCWRYWRSRQKRWLILAGAAFGLMHASKETFVLSLGCAALALTLNQVWNRVLDATGSPTPARRIPVKHLLLVLAIWVFLATLLFTSFFQNPQGLADSVLTYLPWLQRAGGDSPHLHPWYFYFERLFWWKSGKGPFFSELFIMFLAAVGAWAGFSRRELAGAHGSLVRFLTLYSVLLAGVYTVISYKTPWCLLNFWLPAILLAGVGGAVLWQYLRLKPLFVRGAYVVIMGLGVSHLLAQATAANFFYVDDSRNPHIYGHTSKDIKRLVTMVHDIVAAQPEDSSSTILVFGAQGDYWPLPWYLMGYKNVGYYDSPPRNEELRAPIIIASASFALALDEKKTHLMPGYFQLRPGVFLELYVELEAWKRFLSSRLPLMSPENN